MDESSDQGKCKKGKPWNPKNYSIGSAYFKRLRALDLLSILRIFLWQYLSMYTPVSKPNSYEHFDQIRIPIHRWHGSASHWFYPREYLTQMLLIERESAREKESDFEREAVWNIVLSLSFSYSQLSNTLFLSYFIYFTLFPYLSLLFFLS